MKRRLTLMALLLLIVLVFTGCTTQPLYIEELQTGNFFLKYFAYPLAQLLQWLHGLLWNQYGFAILGLTIIVRLLILPLAIKQYKSMKGMQKIQPQMKEIREKYRDNPQQMQAETMKLMQEHQVNPAAGCLPMLIQMPILFALYYAINTVEVVGIKGDPKLEGETFLWFHLGLPDSTFILPLLAAITTVVPMMMTMKNNPPQMKFMLILFPVLIFIISYTLPSALPLYWVYSNVFTIIQTYFLYREKPDPALAVATTSGKTIPVSNGEKSSSSPVKKEEKRKKRRRK